MTTQQPLSSRPHLGQVPDKVTADGLEDKWGGRWEDAGTYSFDRTATREQVYSIDTPPPTVSGSLHVGHVFSYTHTDVVARWSIAFWVRSASSSVAERGSTGVA